VFHQDQENLRNLVLVLSDFCPGLDFKTRQEIVIRPRFSCQEIKKFLEFP